MSPSKTKRNLVKKTRGRPKAEIDLKQLERLCELQCTQEELARFFRVSLSTIKRLVMTPDVREIVDRGAALGRISLRRHQFKLAREGSAVMNIWLGKQYLGQRDQREQTLRTSPEDPLRIEAEVSDRRQAILLNELFTPEEIAAAHAKLQERDHK